MSHWQAEVAKRRERARAEPARILARIEMGTRIQFQIAGSGALAYAVVVDRASVAGQSCTCPDFAKTGLGTCKHVEAARIAAGLPEADPAPDDRWRDPDPAIVAREYELPPGVVCFDIETLRLFSEVGGRYNLAKLGLAVAVTYDSTTDRYESYLEAGAGDLVDKLRSAKLVVGYNILRFDYPVLQAYTTHRLSQLPTLDIMAEIARALPFRPKLADVGALTLGYGKSGDGLEAVRWFRAGQIDRVIAYCRDDVRLVRNLLGHALEHGHLRCPDSGRPVLIETAWSKRLPP